MMDKLTEDRIKAVQDKSWYYSKKLFTDEIKVMFYDCTTLYFESFTEDELRRFGYSKDHKFNQGQVLLALIVTQDGLPVGYELFPGNTNEGKTFKTVIKRIKNRYNIEKIVIVADSGLLSKENMECIEKMKLEYILGARLKNLKKEWQDKIIRYNRYNILEMDDEFLQIAIHQYTKTCKLIVSHSQKRASKDRKDREKAIEKLRQKLEKSKNPESLISNYGYKKFITVDGNVRIGIDEEKLSKESLWDGLHGVFTNINGKSIKLKDVLTQYHGLWQVEESFRINKHDLRMRPVFHWTANRIQSHISICFMAFSLIRFMQYKIKLQLNESISAERIRNELYRVQESIIVDKSDNSVYVIPSKLNDDTIKLYKVMHKKRDVKPFKLS
jgi:transposase